MVLLILLALAAAGCRPKPVGPPPKVHEGIVVRLASPSKAAATLLSNYGKGWSLETGARLEIVPPDADLSADIQLFAPAQLPRAAAEGRLLPIPDALLSTQNPFAWHEVLLLDRNKLTVWDGSVMALPILGSAPLCYYREDLFRDAHHQADFQAKYSRPLAPPATWDEFADLATFFHGRPQAGGKPPVPSLPPLPDALDGLDREFYSIAAPFARRAVREEEHNPPDDELFSFHFDLNTLQPRIDTPGFVEALRLLQRLQPYRARGSGRDPAEAFGAGQAVLCIAGTEWLGRFQEESAAVRGRFGVCPVPGSRRVFDYGTGKPRPTTAVNWVPYLGAEGWFAVIPKTAAQPEAALSLLAYLSGPRTSAEVLLDPAWTGGVFRRDHFTILAAGDPFNLGKAQRDAWVESLRQTLTPKAINPVIRLRIPREREYLRALVEELRPALRNSSADPAKTLAAVAQRWRHLDQAQSEEDRRMAYRLSLGLRAR